MKLNITLCFFLFTYFSLLAQESGSQVYKPKYNTITHKILRTEQNLTNKSGSGYNSMYKLLDDIIDSAKSKLDPIILDSLTDDREKAITILQSINRTLKGFNFNLYIHTYTLTEMLTKKKMDCDTGSMLYIMVAQELNLPIYMVEVPNHSFIRYYYSDAEYLNWDTNVALGYSISPIYSDTQYMHGESVTNSSVFTIEEAVKNKYLQSMSLDDDEAYFYSLVLSLTDLKARETRKVLEKSLELRPFSHLSRNNLAWFLLTTKEYANVKNDNIIALKLATEAVSMFEDNKAYNDTMGCACASNGDFTKAIMYEKKGGNDKKQLDGYKNNQTCFELGYRPQD
ncbi:transglutaminase family protein [Aquimarina megaterium]|uniref:transglutaminase family protein n=1 Tax=Aquimarina megaterium TaxID=1443666 RepID=UPI000471ADED|nr:transglutaminase family protein [Aquimarina megaterium]